MRNASNAVARSIGRGIALVAILAAVVVAAVMLGLIPISFGP
jgi:low affinity Fe/Cu permease